MAFAWYFLACCALAQAVDDGTEMLQVVSGSEDMGPILNTRKEAEVDELTRLQKEKIEDMLKKTEDQDFWTRLVTPVYDYMMQAVIRTSQFRQAKNLTDVQMDDANKFLKANKKGVHLLVHALHESVDDMNQMIKETNAAVEAYHRVVGPKGLSLTNATEEELDKAKPALLEVMGVFGANWKRAVQIGKDNAARIQDHYVHGEGSSNPLISKPITDLMSPERVEKATNFYFGSLALATNYLQGPPPFGKKQQRSLGRQTVDEKRQQFASARSALLNLNEVVKQLHEKPVEMMHSGTSNRLIKLTRKHTEGLLGEEVLHKFQDMIGLSARISKQTMRFTDMVAHFVNP